MHAQSPFYLFRNSVLLLAFILTKVFLFSFTYNSLRRFMGIIIFLAVNSFFKNRNISILCYLFLIKSNAEHVKCLEELLVFFLLITDEFVPLIKL